MDKKNRSSDFICWLESLALIACCVVWGLCVALFLVGLGLSWNPYIVWSFAGGVAILAVTYKLSRGEQKRGSTQKKT